MIPWIYAIQLSMLYIKTIQNKNRILLEKKTSEGFSIWYLGWFGDRKVEKQKEIWEYAIKLNRAFILQLLKRFLFQKQKEVSHSHSGTWYSEGHHIPRIRVDPG